MSKPGDPEPSPDLHRRIAAGLAKISQVLRHQLQRVAQENDLTPLQGQILVHLTRNPGGLRVSQIAQSLAVTAATTSNAISTLVDKGLCRKTKSDPSEHRATIVDLTAQGTRRSKKLALWPDFLEPVISSLSEEEQRSLLGSMIALIRVLEDLGQIPSARMCVSCEFFEPHRTTGGAITKPHYCHFIDAPIGNADLQVDCPDHALASDAKRDRNWQVLRRTS